MFDDDKVIERADQLAQVDGVEDCSLLSETEQIKYLDRATMDLVDEEVYKVECLMDKIEFDADLDRYSE
jgi:hypothetical protein